MAWRRRRRRHRAADLVGEKRDAVGPEVVDVDALDSDDDADDNGERGVGPRRVGLKPSRRAASAHREGGCRLNGARRRAPVPSRSRARRRSSALDEEVKPKDGAAETSRARRRRL